MKEQKQEEKHIYSDKWPKRWSKSLNRWLEIKKMHQNNISPIKIKTKMQGSCGYCEEFEASAFTDIPCEKCSLFQKKICRSRKGSPVTSDHLAYWKLFNELYKDTPNKEIIGLCIDKIITAIEEDDPSKVTASL